MSRFRRLARRLVPERWRSAAAFRLSERRMARQAVSCELGVASASASADLPPPALRVLVAGHADAEWFLAHGRRQAEEVAALSATHGCAFASGGAVLEFGVGCGRLARWIAPQVQGAGGSFTGADLNGRLVRWCQAHLPGRYLSNGLRPPLRLPSASQDVAYAYSVITHLSRPVTEAWLREIARVLRPGGLALISFQDEDFRPGACAEALARDGYAVSTPLLEGSNHLAAFVTRAAFVRLCPPELQVVELRPSDLEREAQAWAVLRRAA